MRSGRTLKSARLLPHETRLEMVISLLSAGLLNLCLHYLHDNRESHLWMVQLPWLVNSFPRFVKQRQVFDSSRAAYRTAGRCCRAYRWLGLRVFDIPARRGHRVARHSGSPLQLAVAVASHIVLGILFRGMACSLLMYGAVPYASSSIVFWRH